jgi:hypothetical protein
MGGWTLGRPRGHPTIRPPVHPSTPQHRPHRERQRVVLADRSPCLVHQRQAVGVGVHRHADVRVALAHQLAEGAELLGHGLRRAGEAPVGLEIQPDHTASEALEQQRHGGAARAAHAVQCHRELAPANPRGMQLLEPQHGAHMARDRPIVRRDASKGVPAAPGQLAVLDQRAQPLALLGLDEQPVRPHELERVPLGRIVARGDRDPARRAVVRHRQLDRGRGQQPAVDHLATHRQEASLRCCSKHRARDAGIATHHDGAAPPLRRHVPERRREPGHQLGRQPDAHDAAHTRHAYDQVV